MSTTRPTAGSTVNRRQALVAAGALGVAGALAACSEDDPTTTTEPDEAADDAGTANPGDDAGTADPGDDVGEESADDAPPEGDVLAAADEVPVGGGVINGDAKVVVTQPEEGEFKAFSSTCTHEGCQVAEVSDGLIRCSCHGSRFFIADGTVENGPATSDLPEIGITVEDGEILRG